MFAHLTLLDADCDALLDVDFDCDAANMHRCHPLYERQRSSPPPQLWSSNLQIQVEDGSVTRWPVVLT